jgi:hypothetical protein
VRFSLRLLACVVCGFLGLVLWSGVAHAEAALSDAGSLSSNPLVIVGSPEEAGQVQAEREAVLASPEAVRARVESQSVYEGISATAAESVANEAFKGLVDEPDGGPPRLPAGERISGFPSDFAASLTFPGGGAGVLDSLVPLAVEDSPGHRTPVDLSVRESSGGGFEPVRPVVGVGMPARLGEGAVLSASGVSLRPVVGEHGVALEGSGVVDGAGVFYGDSEDAQAGVLDVDSLVKPATGGFSMETLLRSQRSPQRLFFKVGLPAGASLVRAGDGSVEVVDGSEELARVLVPTAHDAEGTDVPVSVDVSGDVLVLSVDHQSGQYLMPIVVDPTVIEKTLSTGAWSYSTNNGGVFESSDGGSLNIFNNGFNSYSPAQYGYWVYPTQGESHIYEAVEHTSASNPTAIQSALSIASPGLGKEAELVLPQTGEGTRSPLCTGPCEPGTVTSTNKNNRLYFEVRAVESGGALFSDALSSPSIYILQEKNPTAKMDTADATVNGYSNPLYANTWTNGTGYVGINGFDPGIGLDKERLRSASKPGWLQEIVEWTMGWTDGCQGVQCNECDEDHCPTGATGTPAPIRLGWDCRMVKIRSKAKLKMRQG